ncbi:MAG: hypothetical protein NTW78_12255 [Campylobacterales bacterium]|nr:hypothetical protein [Campylobacterales bacterium]
MLSSLSTSTNNIYSIMSHESAAMSNTDTNKAASIASDVQRSIQETQVAREKGSTDSYKQTLQKIDILV